MSNNRNELRMEGCEGQFHGRVEASFSCVECVTLFLQIWFPAFLASFCIARFLEPIAPWRRRGLFCVQARSCQSGMITSCEVREKWTICLIWNFCALRTGRINLQRARYLAGCRWITP